MQPRVLAIFLLVLQASTSCFVPVEDGLPDGGDPSDRYRSFHGLKIIGERSWTRLTTNERIVEIGSVDLAELQTTAFSQCYDEMADKDSPIMDPTIDGYCTPDIIADSSVNPCLYSYCRARLLVCSGYRALELADSVDYVTIKSKPFSYTAMEYGDGLFFDLTPTGARNMTEITFRIPPLPGPVKTLAYLSANGMFRAAGIQASMIFALAGSGDNQTCLENLAVHTSSTGVTMLDQYVLTLAESAMKVAESAQLLAGNQVNVATASLSKNANSAIAQEEMWSSKLNSHSAAIRFIVGDPEERISMVGIPTKLISPAHKQAVKLLRLARLRGIFDPTVTVSSLINNSIPYIAPDLVIPETHQLVANAMSFFLARFDVTESDFALARKYLQEEQVALDLLLEPDPNPDPNYAERVATLEPTSGQRSGAYFVGKAMSRIANQSSGVPNPLNRTWLDLYYLSELGTLSTLDFIRETVDRLLMDEAATQGSSLLFPEHEHALMAASAHVAATMGKRRMLVHGAFGDPNKRMVYLYGTSEEDNGKLFFILGEPGRRCLETGTIDGARCDFTLYQIKPTTAPTFEKYDLGPRGTMADYWLFSISVDDLPVGAGQQNDIGNVFVFRGEATGRPRLFGVFNWEATESPSRRLYQPAIAGSELDELLKRISTRLPGNAGEPGEMCGDLRIPRDYVPTLENEITESLSGTDGYENSWAHYLTLAREAAAKADELGEKLVQAGLEQDMRAEQAQRELEKICGGMINFPQPPSVPGPSTCSAYDPNCDVVQQYIEDNPAVKNCLPSEYGGGMERIPYSTAGSRSLCVHRNTETLAFCDTDGPTPCPLIYDGTPTKADCEQKFWPGGQPNSAYEVFAVDRTLNIFQSTGSGREAGTTQCEKDVNTLAGLVDSAADVNLKKLLIGRFMANMQWINRETLAEISGQIGLDVDILYHYTMTYGNQTLWTTRVTDTSKCPIRREWSQWSYGSAIDCVRGGPDSLQPDPAGNHGLWLNGELEDPENQIGYAWKRMNWGDDAREQIMALAFLTGSMGDVRQAGWWLREDDYAGISYVLSGDMSPGLFMRVHEVDWADEPLVCLENKSEYDAAGVSLLRDEWKGTNDSGMSGDANIAPCSKTNRISNSSCGEHDYGKFRFEYSLGYEVHSGQTDLNDFWKTDALVAFLAGDGPVGYLWLLRSHYTYDILVRGRKNAEGVTELVFDRVERDTGWATDHNCRRALPRPFDDVITPARFVEALDLACSMARRTNDVVVNCDASDPDGVPAVNSKRDLKKLEAYTRCAANDIQRIAERIIIPNLPEVLVKGFQTNVMEGLYGEFAGDNLKALLAIEDSLRALGTAASDISRVLSEASGQLQKISIDVETIETQKVITQLRTLQGILRATAEAAGKVNITNLASGASISAGLMVVVAALEALIGNFETRVLELRQYGTLMDAMLLFGTKMRELTGIFNNIQNAYSNIQAQLATLDQNQAAASSWWAQGMGLDGELAGRVFPVNTTMRRRMNTLRMRYDDAARRARKLAFIARRAIELRLGVDMTMMNDEMTLVPPPASWADRICEMQGFSYDRLRDAYPEDPLLDPELQESDSYAHWYIGDYVTLLGDFVTSYNLDHPMTDERDIAVISVRDDLIQARRKCEVPSRNKLVFSDDVGTSDGVEDGTLGVTKLVGWTTMGCNVAEDQDEPSEQTVINCVPDPVDPSSCIAPDICIRTIKDATESAYCVEPPSQDAFCFENDTSRFFDIESPDYEKWPHPAERLRDNPLPEIGSEITGRTEHWRNSGFYEQVIPGLQRGDYLLSWWAKLPTGVPAVEYKIELQGTSGSSPPYRAFVGTPPVKWTRIHLDGSYEPISIRLSETQDVIVRIFPSAADDYYNTSGTRQFGDLFIWGMQLERVTCPVDGCPPSPDPQNPNPLTPTPEAYQATGVSNDVAMANCPDVDGSVMRRSFEYKCVCLGFDNGICPLGSEGASYQKCFWEYPFTLLLDRIETSDLIPSNNIAIGNFNYRHESLAVNVVGTNVIECTDPEAPSSCYTNAFLPFTLEQGGWVQIRNHNRETVEFQMPAARVEHGKGLTAEVVLTNPLTSTHNSLLSEYWKDGLRGRPLQGEYMLRIWDSPNLVWSRVEDIQLVWKYRYWTSMGSSY